MAIDNLGELAERIRHLARVPNLLVASDYDGTLAPLVDDPSEAAPIRDAVAAMRSLSEQANTQVTVVSGRSLRDLATISRLPEDIRLVGSHGSEFHLGFAAQLEPEVVERRNIITDEVRELGRRYGARVEEKPAGVTFHLRGMTDDAKESARQDLVRGPAGHEWVFTRNGHDVVEFSVIDANKGTALETIRHQVGASAMIFFGDDVTDEDGFRTLSGPDVGVKVGDGPTLADYRVPGTENVAQLLALLAELRARWLRGEGLMPIQNHSILSDLRTVAVVNPEASISWMCAPRIDSAAIFAELLGGSSAGRFVVAEGPERQPPVSQRYLTGTMVLESQFQSFTLTDCLDSSSGRTRRLAGRSDLLRIVEGSGEVHIEFSPRLDFGRVATRLEQRPEGIAVLGTADLMVLRAPDVEWEIADDGNHQTALGRAVLRPDRPLCLELRCGTGTLRPDARSEQERLTDTAHFWSNWLSKLEIPSTEPEIVARSALLLKSLCHGPTGAIVAAATTSLPAQLGGVRNWDYRYCWLRDAALVAKTLVRLGSRAEAMALLDWVLQLLETRTDPDRLAPVYNVTGRHLPPEAEIAVLPGYGGSRPVRVGNAADGQVQLDLFGSVVDLVNDLLQHGEALSAEHWRLVEALVLAVSCRWQEPDHSIWGIRKPPRHHLYSKVMCWVTVDRAIAIADQFLDREPTAWIDLRERIADDILTNGWNDEIGSFTAAYGERDLDASVLAIGLSGLLQPSDKRFLKTIESVERELKVGPVVRRYTVDDGLPGKEGGSCLMASWLIEALCLTGQQDRAAELFAEFRLLIGDTGILSEQHDPEHHRATGNIPQANSHVGLINSIVTLDESL